MRSCEARFKDGTELSIPKDGIVDPVDIRNVLAGCGSVTVYLAIPVLPSGRTDVARVGFDTASTSCCVRKTILFGNFSDFSSLGRPMT
jgi:predicted component of type VI protein secretion system